MKVTMCEVPMPVNGTELRHLMTYLNQVGASYILRVTIGSGKKVIGSVVSIDWFAIVIQPWDDSGPIATETTVLVNDVDICEVEVEVVGGG